MKTIKYFTRHGQSINGWSFLPFEEEMGERRNSVLIFCRRNQAAMTAGFVFHLNSIFTQNQTPVNDFTDLFVKKKRNMQSSGECNDFTFLQLWGPQQKMFVWFYEGK